MNAVDIGAADTVAASGARRARANLFLIGAGRVGTAFLDALAAAPASAPRLTGLANSRHRIHVPQGLDPAGAVELLSTANEASEPRWFGQCTAMSDNAARVIVDATASVAVARRHAAWLDDGIRVVTANKLAAANGWIAPAHRPGYGDAATVGAGLPILATIRRLRDSGDTIQSIEGVLSGSLTWLFHALQCGRPFARALEQAEQTGYTEPDPRSDLSGADVARKLAIIADAAGIETAISPPRPVLPPSLTSGAHGDFKHRLPLFDAHWRRVVADARRQNRVARYVARLSADGSNCIGVDSVANSSVLAQTRGVENAVLIRSRAYHREPLVIRGPGAGAEVTARAMLADVRRVAGIMPE
jgi:homoserine dehydrogenase